MERLLSTKEVMDVLSIGKSAAYNIMHQMPHLPSPLRVRERDLNEWIRSRMVYPVESKKRRAT